MPDPDPVSNAATEYGMTGFVDGNDSGNDTLDNQLKVVTLKDIHFDGTNYHLDGPNAVIIDVEAPFTGTFEQVDPGFS